MFDFRDRKIRQLYISIVAFLLGGLVLVSSYALWLIYRQKIENGLDLATTQTRLFEDYLSQSFNNIDLALRNIPLVWESGLSTDKALTLALSDAPYLRSISLLTQQGAVIASSNPQNLGHSVVLTDFLPDSQIATDKLRLGAPQMGRDLYEAQVISADHPARPDTLVFLPVLKDVILPDRTLRLLATINTDYFINHLTQMIPPDTGYVEAMRLDGSILFATDEVLSPGSQSALPAGMPDSTRLPRVLAQTSEGDIYLSGYQSSRTLPFLLGVHLQRDILLQPWYKQLRLLLGVIGLSSIVLIGFAVFIYRRLEHTARIQQAADEQLRLSAQVFKSSTEAIFIATAAMRIFSVNRSFTDITGYTANEIIGQPPMLLCAASEASSPSPEWDKISKSQPWIGEVSLRRKNGEIYPAYITISCLEDDSGKATHFIGVFSDITERKISERFRYLSEHDYLTGLPNRRLFEEHIEQAVARVERYGGRFALLFLDLDHFKQINDTLGHHIGDLLLKEVAMRMKTCVRATDALCRQGGDEFLLMVDVSDPEDDASHVAQKLVDTIDRPYVLAGTTLQITPSIGIALCPDHGSDSETLIRHADQAMYETKYHGRNHFEFFRQEMETPAHDSSCSR